MDEGFVLPPPLRQLAAQDLERVLARLVQLTGARRDSDEVRDAAARGEGLATALAALGLRVTEPGAPLERLIATTTPEQPLLVSTREAELEPLLIVSDHERGRVRVHGVLDEAPRWLPTATLAQMAAGVLAVEVAMPLADLTPAGAHHGRSIAEPHSSPPPLRRLMGLVHAERADLWAVLVYAVFVGVLALGTPVAVQALVGTVAFGTLVQPLLVLALMLFATLAFSALLRALQSWVVELVQRRLFVRAALDLAHRLPRVRREALDHVHGPELVNRFFDILTVQKSASSLLLGGLEIALTVSVGLMVLAFYHPILLALDLVLVLAIVVVVALSGRGGVKTAIVESKYKYAIAGWLEELVRPSGAIALGRASGLAMVRAEAMVRDYLGARGMHFRVVLRQLALLLALQAIASAAVLGIGGFLVIERQLTLGQLVAAELLVTSVVASLAKIGRYLESYYDLLAASDKLGHLADLEVEREGGELPRSSERGIAVRVDGVPRAGGGSASMAIEPGERVLVTGLADVGRSELAEVLAVLREPRAGGAWVGEIDVRDLDPERARERAMLLRRGALLWGSLRDNVRLGRASIGDPAVRAALERVGVDPAVLSEGLDTEILPDGGPLTPELATRVLVARALALSPGLLVVDGLLDGLRPVARAELSALLAGVAMHGTVVVLTDDPAALGDAFGRTVDLSREAASEKGAVS